MYTLDHKEEVHDFPLCWGIPEERKDEMLELIEKALDDANNPVHAMAIMSKECRNAAELAWVAMCIGGYAEQMRQADEGPIAQLAELIEKRADKNEDKTNRAEVVEHILHSMAQCVDANGLTGNVCRGMGLVQLKTGTREIQIHLVSDPQMFTTQVEDCPINEYAHGVQFTAKHLSQHPRDVEKRERAGNHE